MAKPFDFFINYDEDCMTPDEIRQEQYDRLRDLPTVKSVSLDQREGFTITF